MKKRDFLFFAAFVSLIVAFAITQINKAEGGSTEEDSTHLVVIEHNTDVNVIEVKDDETGVHYLKTNNGLTVMYNSDGTIKVSK